MPRFDTKTVERGTNPSLVYSFGFSDAPAPRVLTGMTATLTVFEDAESIVLFTVAGVVSTDTLSMVFPLTAAQTNLAEGYYSARVELLGTGSSERWHGWLIVEG